MLCVAALRPGMARAQVLDTLLPADIPGYGEKFSVIAEHRQLAPGDTGWQLGGLRAAPALGLQAGYDSAPDGSAPSGALQETSSLMLADEPAGFGLYGLVGVDAYPQNAAQNLSTALLAGGERIALPREDIVISAAALRSAASGFDFDTKALRSPLPYTVENFRLRDEITSGLFTLTPRLDFSRYGFAAEGAAADRAVPQESLTLAYSSGGPLTSILRLGATQLRYGIASQDANIFEFLAGVQEKQDALWTVSLLAGAAHRAPREGPGLTAPVLETRIDWMPTGLDKISLTASHEIDDPDAISSTAYTKTSIKLSVSHQYLENVTLRALADVAQARYTQTDQREFLASGEIDMQWQASPALAVAWEYRYNTRQSDLVSAANEHVVMLGVTWTP